MTDLKNNLEELWKQEYRDFMLSFYPESSPPVSTWEIYRMAKIKSQKEIKNLLELTEALNQIRDNLQDENRKLEQELEQELQKTREQLYEHRIALKNLLFDETDNSHIEAENLLEKYKEQFKDKQGEG